MNKKIIFLKKENDELKEEIEDLKHGLEYSISSLDDQVRVLRNIVKDKLNISPHYDMEWEPNKSKIWHEARLEHIQNKMLAEYNMCREYGGQEPYEK